MRLSLPPLLILGALGALGTEAPPAEGNATAAENDLVQKMQNETMAVLKERLHATATTANAEEKATVEQMAQAEEMPPQVLLEDAEIPAMDATDSNGEDPLCASWAKEGECIRNPQYMWSGCAKACNALRYADAEDDCVGWAQIGECEKNPGCAGGRHRLIHTAFLAQPLHPVAPGRFPRLAC